MSKKRLLLFLITAVLGVAVIKNLPARPPRLMRTAIRRRTGQMPIAAG